MPVAKGYGRSKNRKKRKKAAIKLLLIGCLLLLVCLFIGNHVRPVIETVAGYQAKTYATDLINNAVYEQVNQCGYTYQDLVTISRNESGQVTSIETNVYNLNQIHTSVTQSVSDVLMKMEGSPLYIPLGSLTNIAILSGRGPKIEILTVPRGTVHTQIVSSLSEAGINQTLHRLTIHITVNIAAIIPGCSSENTVELEYPLAETVIVGSVPGFYTKVVTDSSETVQDASLYSTQRVLPYEVLQESS